MRPPGSYRTILAGGLLAVLLPAGLLAQGGSFRFLTQSLPDGTTNAVYSAALVTANSSGAVTYAVGAGTLPPGLLLDGQTGFITGRPTNSSNYSVTFTADDGAQVIQLALQMNISSSGGGGNGGLEFSTASLSAGRVGVAYSQTVGLNNGVGPFVFGAADLPYGLTLDGASGEIHGTPLAAGTFSVNFSATDRGENDNKVFTIFPLVIRPATVEFRFATSILDNGEVGSLYEHQLVVQDTPGSVRYSASGLPPGVAIDRASGMIAGTPTEAGTFLINVSATSAGVTITLGAHIIIAPSASSHFFWSYFGLPIASSGIPYTRQPPILLEAINGTTVSYTARGLPEGIAFNSSSGELSGTATEVGIYPAVFTATDAATAEVLEIALDFAVLPAGGGSVGDIPTNLWVRKEKFKSGDPGRDSWKAMFYYNLDRRTGQGFDPASDDFAIALGSRRIELAPGQLVADSKGRFSYRSDKGAVPSLAVVIDPARQTIALSTKGDTLYEGPATVLRNALNLGNRGFRLDAFFDDKGGFKPALAYRKVAFVAIKARIRAGNPGADSLKLSLLLADPAFAYTSGQSALRFRLLLGGTALVDKTFTTLVTSRESIDSRTGATLFRLKGGGDSASTEVLARFTFQSKSGKMGLAMTACDLSALAAVAPAAEHLSLELTVGERIYTTVLTVFSTRDGTYGERMPSP